MKEACYTIGAMMTKALAIDPVIAERHLSGGLVDVTIRIGLPFVQNDSISEVWCPYQIKGIGSEQVRKAVGIDGIQAIELALKTIAAELYISEEFRSGNIKWFADSQHNDLGLPVPEFLRDLAPRSSS